MRKLISLFGPTGSGKTRLALALADKMKAAGFEAVIVNADSRQVYKGLPLLSAAPTAAEYAEVEHKLFEFLEPMERYSAGTYGKDARAVVEEIITAGKVPVVVGGTGFYIKALLEGVGNGPDVPAEVYEKWNKRSVYDLWTEVKQEDPDWAAKANESERSNRQRLVRVLAVKAQTGKLMSAYQAEEGAAPWVGEVLKLALDPAADVLKAKLEARMAELVEAGLMNEVNGLEALGPEAPALQALGTKVWQEALKGDVSVAGATLMAVQQHVDYTKRQRTWLRGHYAPDFVGAGPEEIESFWGIVEGFLGDKKGT